MSSKAPIPLESRASLTHSRTRLDQSARQAGDAKGSGQYSTSRTIFPKVLGTISGSVELVTTSLRAPMGWSRCSRPLWVESSRSGPCRIVRTVKCPANVGRRSRLAPDSCAGGESMGGCNDPALSAQVRLLKHTPATTETQAPTAFHTFLYAAFTLAAPYLCSRRFTMKCPRAMS